MEVSDKQIFLSYVREDRETAERLFRDLRVLGYSVWMDQESLPAGSRWREVIKIEIRKSALFIALFSKCSIDKRGFAQAEVRQALEVLEEIPPGRLFFIPIRLDDCEPGDRWISEYQRIDLFPDYRRGLERLVRDIRAALGTPTPPRTAGTASAPLLAELLECASRLAVNSGSLLSVSEKNLDPRVLAMATADVRAKVRSDANRITELAPSISLLCSDALIGGSQEIVAAAMLLKIYLLNPDSLSQYKDKILALPEAASRFRLLARQELGLIG